MIWTIVIGILLMLGIGYQLVRAPKTPLSANPTEYAFILSARRQAWQIMNYRIMGNKHYFIRYAYLYVYVRKGRRDALNEENCFIRELIWDFKEGIYDAEVVHRVALLIQKVAGVSLDKKVLICIPASSHARNEKRFMNFSNEVCQLTGLQNGFGWITVRSTRKESHRSGERTLLDWESIIDVPKGKLKNAELVLFDDVLTTGNSSGSFKVFLESKGARVSCAIFLATVPENQ